MIQWAAAQATGILTVAYQSVRDQIQEAVETLKRMGRGFRRFPRKFVPVSYSVTPSIAAHVALVQGGIPEILTRVDSVTARRNRATAVGGLPPAGSGLSWDEYPFASTFQGGAGASVSAVPEKENWIQGGVIGASYSIQRINVGDDFWAVVIP
jgi:hypothetical protein